MYKAHLHQTIGNGKLHPSRTQCGRKISAASKGSFIVKTQFFKEIYKESKDLVCVNCLAWAVENKIV